MQARLRAQLGDRSEYSGERRSRSVVVASIVLTITDPLRGSYPLLCNLQAALIRSCGASFACMELTIISRFQRLQTSRKYSLHSLFYNFSVLSPLACFDANTNVSTHWKHTIRRTVPLMVWRVFIFVSFYAPVVICTRSDCKWLISSYPSACRTVSKISDLNAIPVPRQSMVPI